MTHQPFQLAAISVNQIPLDWEGNRARILASLRELAANGTAVSCAVFPELSVSGYGCEDAYHSIDVTRRSWHSLIQIAREARAVLPDTLLFVGLPIRKNDRIYNCMAALYDGKVRGIIAKQNLAGDGVHYEPRWFTPWRGGFVENFSPDGLDIRFPFGTMLLSFEGITIGIEICEDAWVARRPARKLAGLGMDVLLNPSASHFAIGKQQIRRNIAAESSRVFGVHFVTVNLLGCESGRMIYDGGAIIASDGKIIHETERFSFQDHLIATVAIKPEANRIARGRLYAQKYEALQSGTSIPILPIEAHPRTPLLSAATPARSGRWGDFAPVEGLRSDTKENEFFRAVILALYDYMRKSHSRGFVVSLSGGVDSTVCALLIQRMVLYSCAELGIEPALERLGLGEFLHDLRRHHPAPFFTPGNREELIRAVHTITPHILYTIYQKTVNSSSVTESAAATVAELLASRHFNVSVDEAIRFYTETIEQQTGESLVWGKHDLTLQNIQARARSPLAWMVANLTGSLLITTSNRSEASTGYCTMDGDTSGGLAPVAGIDKAFLIHWLKFMERTGDPLGGAMPQLNCVTEQLPTAELRPLEAKQTDESELMPYPLLDRIEKLAILDRKSPVEIYRELLEMDDITTQFDHRTLKQHIEKFFRLWSRNQWKRERYAPSFHLDDESVDPKSWYRFPILNAGYTAELKEMEEAE